MSPSRISCLLADDHPLVVRTLAQLMAEWEFTLLASAHDGSEALRKIEQLKPAVALIDLRMPGLSGVEVVRQAVARDKTAVVVYTGDAEVGLLRDALDAGARGIVMKDAPLDDLRRALTIVAQGGIYIDPALAFALIAPRAVATLSQRECDVFRLLAAGCTYSEIGAALYISPETVRTHIGKAVRKLGARTKTEAVARAVRDGIIA